MFELKVIGLKIIFLFYKYYDKGSTKSIAYENSLMVFNFILSLNGFALLVACKLNPVFFEDYTKSQKYMIIFTLILIGLFIAKKVFPKKEIVQLEMSESAMRIGYGWLVLYIIFSVALLVFVILWRK